jgi:hypothetical protein
MILIHLKKIIKCLVNNDAYVNILSKRKNSKKNTCVKLFHNCAYSKAKNISKNKINIIIRINESLLSGKKI